MHNIIIYSMKNWYSFLGFIKKNFYSDIKLLVL